jgi:hypothetical protein
VSHLEGQRRGEGEVPEGWRESKQSPGERYIHNEADVTIDSSGSGWRVDIDRMYDDPFAAMRAADAALAAQEQTKGRWANLADAAEATLTTGLLATNEDMLGRSPPRTDAPQQGERWEVEFEQPGHALDDLLRDGWEPFGIGPAGPKDDGEDWVYVRRRVSP